MNSNVLYPLPHRFKPQQSSDAFTELTDAIVQAQAAAGTLNPAILAALLAAVRQPVVEGGR